jgi:phosphoribosylformimino-5-aminoimidazole carboxamide ribotide isomerase
MQIIPAIDIIGGKCVRLTKGAFDDKTIYHSDPLEVAIAFEHQGLKRLHLVDLDGAKNGKTVNWEVLQSICLKTKMEVDFSGGISSADILKKVFDLGATYATLGSIAVKDSKETLEWIRKFSPQKFIIGADVKKGNVMIKGWTEKTNLSVLDLIKEYTAFGITQFMCTDVDKDGMLAGPAIDLYKSILTKYPWIKLIASGGVSSLQDLYDLKNTGVFAAITGKAIYENKISLTELSSFT